MRLPSDPRFPEIKSPNFLTQLTNLYRDIVKQLNLLTEGKIVAITNSGIAAPTAGTYAQGDKVWHSAPVEAGSASSKYIILGYVCVVAGTPGTWREMRVLTGN